VLAWAIVVGDTLDDRVGGVAIDGAGNTLLSGRFEGDLPMPDKTLQDYGTKQGSTPQYDVFLATFDENGNLTDALEYGKYGPQEAYALALDGSNNALVAGRYREALYDHRSMNDGPDAMSQMDPFVMSVASDYTRNWAVGVSEPSAATNTQYAYGVAADSAGNVAIVGTFRGQLHFDNTNLTISSNSDEMFAAVFNNAGADQWAKDLGTNGDHALVAAAFVADGELVAGGWAGGDDIALSPGGQTLTALGNEDALLVRFDSTGGQLWGHRFGDGLSDLIRGVAVDSGGNVIAVGRFQGQLVLAGLPTLTSFGSHDIFVAKFASDGTPLWSRHFGDTQSERARGVAVLPGDAIAVVGSFSGDLTVAGTTLTAQNGDAYVLALDADGSDLWALQLGLEGDQVATSVASRGSRLAVAGELESGRLPLGGVDYPANSADGTTADVFLAVYDLPAP
jgi:hypothetical protein